jgi:hypothetical protein
MSSSAAVATQTFLDSLASIPHLPPDTYHWLASVVFAAIHRPFEIPAVIDHAVKHQQRSREELLAEVREGLLKAAVITGFPPMINALLLLPKSTAPAMRKDIMVRHEEVYKRGNALWDAIYGERAQELKDTFRQAYADLYEVSMVQYGVVYAEDSVLGFRESSMVQLVALTVGGEGTSPQRKGHRQGLVNQGGTWEQGEAIEILGSKIMDAA